MNKDIIALIQELFGMTELHQEYTDNDISFAIDSQKLDSNTIQFTIKLKENKDKKEFEEWIKQVPEDIFSEVITSLDENIFETYNSENYKEIIDKVKSKISSLMKERINTYQNLLGA